MKELKLFELEKPLFKGKFMSRPNRFSATLKTLDGEINCHLHDPGRLTELLVPGAEVLYHGVPSHDRKTLYDIVAVARSGHWIVVDSRIPNRAFRSMIEKSLLDYTILKEEYTFSNSRIDFLLERGLERYLAEVKGCSLCVNNGALFPDAPTARGRRHILELVKWNALGMKSLIFFVVFCPLAESIAPNRKTDPGFTQALESALESGVEAKAAKVVLEEASASLWFKGFIPVWT